MDVHYIGDFVNNAPDYLKVKPIEGGNSMWIIAATLMVCATIYFYC